MFRIGEFSKMVRVSARMLRYYEKSGLLKPAETDRFTGYRMYSADQIPLLYKIVQLRDMGFGVDEISGILPHFDNMEVMHEVLKRKSIEIHTAIANEHTKLEKIAVMNGMLERKRIGMVFDVELKELKAQTVLSLRDVISSYDKEGQLWERLGEFMGRNQVACGSGGYSIYHDDDYKESDVDLEIAVPVYQMGESQGKFVFKELEEIPVAATVRFSGSYQGYSEAIQKLAAWVEHNGYVFAGNVRGLAIASPSDVSSPDDYMTEIQVAVKKA